MVKLLAFDYGASSGRGILGQFDGERLQIEEIHRFSNDPVMIPTGLHWDILRLFHEMKQGILKCSQQHHHLQGIAVDTWGVDFAFINSAGELLGNPYHYRDRRTDGKIELACSRLGRDVIYKTTGIAFQPFNSLYQLMAAAESHPALLEQAETLLFIPDLLNYFLTGEKACEYTIASTSQMLDIETADWAYGMLQQLGLPTHSLTSPVHPGIILGKARSDIGTELNINNVPVILAASHDTASAVAAVPATGRQYVYLSSGTWSLMGVELSGPQINY